MYNMYITINIKSTTGILTAIMLLIFICSEKSFKPNFNFFHRGTVYYTFGIYLPSLLILTSADQMF